MSVYPEYHSWILLHARSSGIVSNVLHPPTIIISSLSGCETSTSLPNQQKDKKIKEEMIILYVLAFQLCVEK